jgi:phosphoribosylglycinamide formyltransferase-1
LIFFIFICIHPVNPLILKILIKNRIAIFASGSGSNAEEIVTYFNGHPSIAVELVLSNNANAFVLERAKRLGIPSLVFSKEEFGNSAYILHILGQKNITHIVLAGFLWLIPSYLIQAYPDKIINIHPALLPKFGGKGMYGLKVHEAVKLALEKETGITIHLVNEKYDEGKILFQGRCIVEPHFTPSEIAACVQKLEYEHYSKVIEEWITRDN